MYISVIGAAECGEELSDVAYRVGSELAKRGHVLVCGGLGGVMDAVAHGVHDGGGLAVGVLPGAGRLHASKYLSVAIPTGLGHARNAIVALAGNAIIAVGGGYGTLSEIAIGLKIGRPVVGLDTWKLEKRGREETQVVVASGPEEAVSLAEKLGAAHEKKSAGFTQ